MIGCASGLDAGLTCTAGLLATFLSAVLTGTGADFGTGLAGSFLTSTFFSTFLNGTSFLGYILTGGTGFFLTKVFADFKGLTCFFTGLAIIFGSIDGAVLGKTLTGPLLGPFCATFSTVFERGKRRGATFT